MNKTLTTGEIASFCGVHYRTVLRWIEAGQLSAYKLPGRGHHRIAIDDFLTFLKNNNIPVPDEFSDVKKSILIIEDEQAMANAIARVLKNSNYKLVMADNGFRAGVLLSSLQPELITLDINIPGLDGMQVLEFIRASKNLENTKVLVISALEISKLEKTLIYGADGYLTKPFDNDDLLTSVSKLLGEPFFNC